MLKCALSQDEKSLSLLLESSWDRERNVISHVGRSYLAASKEEKEREGELPFMVPGEVCLDRIASVILIG